MPLLDTVNSLSLATIIKLQPAVVNSGITSVQTFTIKGLNQDGVVLVNAPALEAGLFLIQESVTAKDTLSLTFWNNTGLNITPALQNFVVVQL